MEVRMATARAGGRSVETPAESVDGRWLIETQWLPDESGGLSHVTTLFAVVPKRIDAGRYRIAAVGFNDPLYYGDRLQREFDASDAVANPAAWDDTRVLDRGDAYWLSLSRAAGPAAQAEAARDWLQARFAGLRVSACVVERPRPVGARPPR
jgi:hypothetical protein